MKSSRARSHIDYYLFSLMNRRLTIFVLICLGWSPALRAADTSIDFDRDIRPILSDNCYHCHGPDAKARKGKLRLDDRDAALAPRRDYHVIKPGDPDKSLLLSRIESADPQDRMPPVETGLKLTPAQRKALRQWIADGAKWEAHWAFVKPSRPALPNVNQNDWARNPIDRFILAQLEAKGLSPSPRASKESLIRRVTLDLTGLPPTPAEVDAFVNDKSPDAYEKVVDRLLASPRYGERMAWPWLDAARYADSNGYQGDRERTMWPWRDWVVKVFNDNLSYDKFTVWQLAGDLLPGATFEQRLATGFNRNHMINGEGGRIPEENRVEYVFDQLETTGTVWLGLTFNCARCHDHKFDPLTQRDYFGLFAFFNQTPINGGGGDPRTPPVLAVPTAQQKQRIADLEAQIARAQQQVSQRVAALKSQQAQWKHDVTAKLERAAWRVLRPDAVKTLHQKAVVQDDGSVLISGPNPANDTYTFIVTSDLANVTGLRLEALRHASMTHGGLARSDSGNFVLTEMEITTHTPPIDGGDAAPLRVAIASGQATYEQGNHKITGVFDGKRETGWAVWQGKPVARDHQAVLRFEKPVPAGPNTTWKIVLRHDSPHKNHNLGRFRLSLTDAAEPKLGGGDTSLRDALQTPAAKRNKSQNDLIAKAHQDTDAKLKQMRDEVGKLQKAINDTRNGAPKVMVMQDMAKPRPTYILDKGLYSERRATTTAASPAFLPAMPDGVVMNRLALANWIVSPDNPLTARVTVNRFWQQVFGRGLVKTAEDFGSQGRRPTHPRLLDWLAVEFIESGWDVKALMRLMVTGATYQQSSRVSDTLIEYDPQNQWLARGPRHRMPSWMIRDQALAVSGLMTPTIGGPPVNPYQPQGVWAEATFGKKRYTQSKGADLYRRSMYTFWRRIIGPTMFFDSSPRQVCSVLPVRTNTPLHALATMNDITYVEAARALAERVLKSGDANDMARFERLYRLVLARAPSDAERGLLVQSITRLRQQYLADGDAAAKLLAVGESKRDETIDPVEHAAWAALCLAVLNLDETLTRE